MAFLYKEKKNFQVLPHSETKWIGPGQYIPQTIKRNIRPAAAPFGIGAKRLQPKVEDFPGPGKYYKELDIFHNEKNIQKERILTEINKERKTYKVIVDNQSIADTNTTNHNTTKTSLNRSMQSKTQKVRSKGNFEVIGFSIQEKRFSDTTDPSIPGPGFYISNSSYSVPAQKKKKNKWVKLRICEESAKITGNHVPSIPPKNMLFGYTCSDNGRISPNNDPNMLKTFSGVGYDKVGPGNYNTWSPEEWLRTGTSWSKVGEPRLIPFKDKNTIYKRIIKSWAPKEPIQDNEKLYKAAIEVKNNSWGYKYNIKPETAPILIRSKIFEDVESKARKAVPGPGYYYDDSKYSSFDIRKHPPTKMSDFGSKQERFKYTEDKEELGPTRYYREDWKKLDKLRKKFGMTQSHFPKKNTDKKGQQNNVMNTTMSKIETQTAFKGIKDNSELMPSESENPSLMSTKFRTFNSKYDKFGATEPRFTPILSFPNVDKADLSIPGPGTYINPYTCDGTNNTVKFKDRLMTIEQAKKLDRKQSEKMKSRIPKHLYDLTPPVGFYSPEVVTSINFKSNKKCFGFCGESVPFDCGGPKVASRNEKYIIGPGKYFNEKEIKFRQVNPRSAIVQREI